MGKITVKVIVITQLTCTCSKSAKEILEKDVECVHVVLLFHR